mmetsp:Transcript_20462/g.29661  ORF Transcript_20462/g.29661 Transcript_20462/m.29661 type:complete len:346 (-) Transcript_20462:148-1185(-)
MSNSSRFNPNRLVELHTLRTKRQEEEHQQKLQSFSSSSLLLRQSSSLSSTASILSFSSSTTSVDKNVVTCLNTTHSVKTTTTSSSHESNDGTTIDFNSKSSVLARDSLVKLAQHHSHSNTHLLHSTINPQCFSSTTKEEVDTFITTTTTTSQDTSSSQNVTNEINACNIATHSLVQYQRIISTHSSLYVQQRQRCLQSQQDQDQADALSSMSKSTSSTSCSHSEQRDIMHSSSTASINHHHQHENDIKHQCHFIPQLTFTFILLASLMYHFHSISSFQKMISNWNKHDLFMYHTHAKFMLQLYLHDVWTAMQYIFQKIIVGMNVEMEYASFLEHYFVVSRMGLFL